LEALVERSSASDVAITVDIALGDHGSSRLPRQVEETVYRVVQEGLTNVAKHASATHASVAVRRLDGVVELEVADDGVGIDRDAAGHDGYGLVGMLERIDLVGGTLDVGPAEGGGTRLHARIPV
jgi:signal transduction histidine kinase